MRAIVLPTLVYLDLEFPGSILKQVEVGLILVGIFITILDSVPGLVNLACWRRIEAVSIEVLLIDLLDVRETSLVSLNRNKYRTASFVLDIALILLVINGLRSGVCR